MKKLIIDLQNKITESDYPLLTTRNLYIELENMLSVINKHQDESSIIQENEVKIKECFYGYVDPSTSMCAHCSELKKCKLS